MRTNLNLLPHLIETNHLDELIKILNKSKLETNELLAIKNGRNRFGLHLIQQAAQNGLNLAVLQLLNVGVRVDSSLNNANDIKLEQPELESHAQKTPFYLALENQHYITANILLTHGANKNRARDLANQYHNEALSKLIDSFILDTDIQRAVLFWRINNFQAKHSNNLYEALIPSLVIQNQQALDEKIVASDTKTPDEKSPATDAKDPPINNEDIGAMLELSAFNSHKRNNYIPVIEALFAKGQLRSLPFIRTAASWELLALFNGTSTIAAICAVAKTNDNHMLLSYFQLNDCAAANREHSFFKLAFNLSPEMDFKKATTAAFPNYAKNALSTKNYNMAYQLAATGRVNPEFSPDAQEIFIAFKEAIKLKNYVAFYQLMIYPYHKESLIYALEENNRALAFSILLNSNLSLIHFMHSILNKPVLLNRFIELCGGIKSILNFIINQHTHITDLVLNKNLIQLLDFFKIDHTTLLLDLLLKSLHERHPDNNFIKDLFLKPQIEFNLRTDNWRCPKKSARLIADKFSQFGIKQTVYNKLLQAQFSPLKKEIQYVVDVLWKAGIIPYLNKRDNTAMALTSKHFYRLCKIKKLDHIQELVLAAEHFINCLTYDRTTRSWQDNCLDSYQANPPSYNNTICCLSIFAALFITGTIEEYKRHDTAGITSLTFSGLALLCVWICFKSLRTHYQNVPFNTLTLASLSASSQNAAEKMVLLANTYSGETKPFSLNLLVANLESRAQEFIKTSIKSSAQEKPASPVNQSASVVLTVKPAVQSSEVAIEIMPDDKSDYKKVHQADLSPRFAFAAVPAAPKALVKADVDLLDVKLTPRGV